MTRTASGDGGMAGDRAADWYAAVTMVVLALRRMMDVARGTGNWPLLRALIEVRDERRGRR